MTTYKYPATDATAKCIPNNPDDYVSFCVFNHNPLIDQVLSINNINRCRPTQPLAPSAFTNVCSVDSHILTGLKACTGNISTSRCPNDVSSTSTRLVVDDTVAEPSIKTGQYLLPILSMPRNIGDIVTMVAPNATPHFQGLMAVLQHGVGEMVRALVNCPGDLMEIITEESMVQRLLFFTFFIEIITFSELFHGLNMPTFGNDLLSVLAKNAREKFLSRVRSRPVVNPRNFLANEVLSGGEVLTKNTPQLNEMLKSISTPDIRPLTAPVLEGKREDVNERPSGMFTSPLVVNPDCSRGRDTYVKTKPFSIFRNGPVISVSVGNPTSTIGGVVNDTSTA